MLGHIGWAVGAGFGVGSVRGALPEMLNKETMQLVRLFHCSSSLFQLECFIKSRISSHFQSKKSKLWIFQRGKPWLTRMANATVKHGSGFAQPAGVAVFMYSALDIGLRKLRADDDLNSIAAGALTGAIYRSPHGMRAVAIGSAVGTLCATAWVLLNQDSRERMMHMVAK